MLTPYMIYLFRHNDLADAIRMYFENQLDKVDLSKNETGFKTSWQTDIPRLRAGKVGGQVKRLLVTRSCFYCCILPSIGGSCVKSNLSQNSCM